VAAVVNKKMDIRFHKRREISWLVWQLSASQEERCFIELVNVTTITVFIFLVTFHIHRLA
jgi:hypothetical protein